MKNKQRTNTKKRYTVLLLVISIIAIILVALLCWSYYYMAKETISEESEWYISEISKQLSSTVSKNISSNFSALYTIEASLNISDLDSFDHLSYVVDSLKLHWQYNEILFIDKNAQSYDRLGNKVRLPNDEYLQSALVGRKESISISEIFNGKECMVFVVPVDIVVGDVNILAIAATFDLDTFDKVLSMKAFDGKGFSHIIDKKGTLLIRSNSENVFDHGYNILNSIEGSYNGANDITKVREDIDNGIDGITKIVVDDEYYYMSYMMLGESFANWRIVTFVPVGVVSDRATMLLKLILLVSGVLTVMFAVLLGIVVMVTIKNRKKLEKIAYVDNITKGNTIEKFSELAKGMLKENKREGRYCLIYTNIGKFKVLNEQYGREHCDELLRVVNNALMSDLKEDECVGRMFADNFVMLIMMEGKEQFLARIEKWKKYFNGENILPFTLELGLCLVDAGEEDLNKLIDNAKLSLKQSTRAYEDNRLRISLYDDKLGRRINREKYLEDMMEDALLQGEFEVYFQPKYSAKTDEIEGAEALSRWNSKREGMIYPNEFIPLFEKNSFIQRLDLYVFEFICKRLRSWIDAGIKPIKLSANCSRIHFRHEGFIEKYLEIAEKYRVPFKYLEIEVTESAVFEDVDYFRKTINEIREVGFSCSMDDFGSGYSSLNMIQDIPVDTIKIDKIFFKKRDGIENERTEAVIAGIINLSKSLNMVIVAEGVEEKEQVDILKRLDCDLIQGYYYAKPMPIDEFEKLYFVKSKLEVNE